MAPKIQHKRSAVAGKAPLPADLEYGEIAVNYEATDPALYVKDSANVVRKIGTQPDATEAVKGIVELATAAETTTGTDDTRAVHPAGLKVELDKKAKKTITSDTAPASPADGDLWYDSVGGELYVWYDSDDAGAVAGTWVQANPQVTPKQATATAAGVDVKLWKKTGTTLEPETANDSVSLGGQLLVGTSTARGNYFNSTLSAALQVEGTGHDSSSVTITRNSNDGAAPTISLAKSRGTTVGSNTVIQNGDDLGYLAFQGSDGSEFVGGAYIYATVDGTPGANDLPTRLVFSTTADGASSPTERMRIASDGNIAINCTGLTNDAPNVAGGLYTSTNGNIKMRVTSDGVSALQFYSPTGGTSAPVGSIVVNASSTSYSTTSDYRLKENIVPLTGAANRLNQLQVHRFNFIADPNTTVDGFIAHEAQAVVPECVTGAKDEVDDDGNPVYQGIDQSKLVPLLTAALQEAVAKIEVLETRITTLEARP